MRYADDFAMGFQYDTDAQQMLVDLRAGLVTLGLVLHGAKTHYRYYGLPRNRLDGFYDEVRPRSANPIR